MNELFLARMKELLKDEYEAYEATLENSAFKGIRINLLKNTAEEFLRKTDLDLTPTPFCKEGFYLRNEEKLGNTIEHLQGLFYIQEPSASSAVEILDVKENDWVLDLCAAPGGKSTQIASKLKNTGFLFSNEVNPSRSQVLLSNMERCGVSNAIITNAYPEKLCPQIQGWFDKVLVDAPCSGEGMFKKEDQAIADWSVSHVEACAKRQLNILESAYLALKKNGVLVYSTCTYSPEENEGVIDAFLRRHPDMEQLDCGVNFGRTGYDKGLCKGSAVCRIFPMDQGEGHFVAKLKRNSDPVCSKLKSDHSPLNKCAETFFSQQLDKRDFYIRELNNKVYLSETPFVRLEQIKILRQGVLAGEIVKKRFEPHQHFYTSAMLYPHLKRKTELSKEQCGQFIHGLSIAKAAEKGYTALTYNHQVIGFGKSDGTVIKNKFPKGLRI